MPLKGYVSLLPILYIANQIILLQVFTRLNKLGVSVCHKSALRFVRAMGEKHDETVCQWKAALELEPPPAKGFVIVGDNIDKRITPQNMRIDHQVQSLHYFHSFAARNRIPTSHLDDKQQMKDINDLSLSDFLPTVADCTAIRSNFVVLVARTLVGHLDYFSRFKKAVPTHIKHQYSKQMVEKSVVVRFEVQ